MIYFTATPIGNLKDITLRALEALREADAVFCEDTRHTLKLLSAYDIRKPLYSCHKFNESEAAEKIIALSREGKNVCVVSDAGMPVISDPGKVVVQKISEAGEKFTVLPGACAFVTALALSALPSDQFTFLGFLPDKAGQRKQILKTYENASETLVFHVAPQDVDEYIAEMYSVFGSRAACVVREITKIHEEAVYFRLEEGLAGEKRGEYVLIVEGKKETKNPLNALSVREHVKHYMDSGMQKKDAIKAVCRDRGLPKNEVYQEVLDL